MDNLGVPSRPTPVGRTPVRPGVASDAGVQVPVGLIVDDGGFLGHLFNGDPGRYTHLDPWIVETTSWVQDVLVREGHAHKIAAARTDGVVRLEVTTMIDRLALQHLLDQGTFTGTDRPFLIESVTNEIVGLGPLEPLWSDSTITEVIVNGPKSVYVERGGKLSKATGCVFRDATHLLDTCQRILVPLNRKVDVKDPLADGRLPDGSRVNIVHTCLAPGGPMLTIRRFPESSLDIGGLVAVGALSEDMATDLATWVSKKATILVAGGTGSGKALALSTPIPTPLGPKLMGELLVGDLVYGTSGSPVVVTGVYDTLYDRTCFRVDFADGDSVIADGGHLWNVFDGRVACTLATSELAAAYLPSPGLGVQRSPVSSAGVGPALVDAGPVGVYDWDRALPGYLYYVPPVQVINYPHTALPVDALTVGGVIGDNWFKGLFARIPEGYLYASVDDRTKLLEGILGGLGAKPEFKCGDHTVVYQEFPTVVASQMRELLTSLGTELTVDQPGGGYTGFTFTWGGRSGPKGITNISAVPSVPVKCITVDSPDHLYLAGTGHTPTHNTTVLNALSEFIPTHERVITIEDALELRLHPDRHVAALEARPSDATGSNAIPIRLLVRNALRMRPDRIVVGEIRDSAAVDMLQACNTGHEGSMSTVHANGPNETLSRLHVMIAQGGEIPTDKIDWLIADALDIIVMVRRYEDGSRRISGIHELIKISKETTGQQTNLTTSVLWEWQHTHTTGGKLHGRYHQPTPISSELATKLRLETNPKPGGEPCGP